MEAPIAFTEELVAAPSPASEVYSNLQLIDKLYNYNHWIYNRLRPFIGDAVCEVGCGIGNITQFLLRQDRVVGIEPYHDSVLHARHRFADHRNVSFAQYRIEQCPNDELPSASFDTVICSNVLEHIEDDVCALAHMRALCREDGQVVILVPAHMSAFGAMDDCYGHFRRYNRSTLRSAFAQAGLNVTDTFYMNAIGYFGWLWEGRILRRKRINPAAAQAFNRMVPFIDVVERMFPLPFGQSIVMVGTPA